MKHLLVFETVFETAVDPKIKRQAKGTERNKVMNMMADELDRLQQSNKEMSLKIEA